MLRELVAFFEGIDLIWCDNPGKKIQDSENYVKLMKFFPNLQNLHQVWLKNDNFEFNRTIRHVFRSLKIYFLLKQGKFSYSSLSDESLNQIREKIEKFVMLNELYLPIILIYHDIGRFVDRKTHAKHSSDLIRTLALFDSFDLSPKERLLLRKVIEYHLLLATIYTGESTFFGIVSLLHDDEFIELILSQDRNYAELFINLLELFTYLDILGYPYSRIFNHYLIYYDEINRKLRQLLGLWPKLDEIVSLAKLYSSEWLNWRLAGALRIFQFVGTKPYLTEQFYYNLLKESIRSEYKEKEINFQWKIIKNEYLSNTYKFQLNYALPFLMLLAIGEFKRLSLKQNQTISSKLIKFWMSLSLEVKKRGLNDEEMVWNIYFEKIPFWSEITKNFVNKLEMDNIESIIHAAKLVFNDKKKEYNFYLDFSRLIE